MAPNVQLTKDKELFEDPERYRRLIGKLNYLIVTRPNIAYSVSVLSQYMSSPTVSHPVIIEHILCYLREALNVEYRISSIGIPELSVFHMQTEPDLRNIGDPHQDIVSMLEGI